jgi:N-carbamoyl-L-amino-acid hydrolase
MVVRVDKDRLWSLIETQGEFGGDEGIPGALDRPPLSDADAAVRDWFCDELEAAKLDVRVDAMGNIFGRRKGTDPDATPILTGSHLDSVGGKFDGSLGVVGALEAVKTLNDEDIETRRPIEIVNWTNEERSRFAPAVLSSGVWAGAYDKEEAYVKTDDDGLTFESELERIGYKGDEPAEPAEEYAAYLELHTEQGPYLDAKDKDVGVVTDITGWHRGEITFRGDADHPGPTPMEFRRDPVVAMADVVTQIRRLAGVTSEHTVGTVSRIDPDPNDIRFIADAVAFTWDVRDPDPATLGALVDRVLAEAEVAAEREGVEWDWREIVSQDGVACAEQCVDAVQDAADALDYDSARMCSMALHDARHVAEVVDTAMIFAVAEDGVSHNPREYTSSEDCAKAANTLTNALVDLADGEAA